jgi:hypothetical protein
VRAQQRDDVSGGAEGVGDRGPVAERQGRAHLAVDLGHEQWLGGNRTAVERGKARQRRVIIGVAGTDRDGASHGRVPRMSLGAQGVHASDGRAPLA